MGSVGISAIVYFFSTYKLSLWLVKLNVLIEEKDRIVAKFLIFTHKHSSLALF